jgi:hypothetical protein
VHATYESQRKSKRGRLYAKAKHIRARFGDYGRPCIDPLPLRPFGMHRKIYERLSAQAKIIEYKLVVGRIYRPRQRRQTRDYAPKAY